MTTERENYLHDLILEIKDMARKAKQDPESKKDPFKKGYLFAMHAVVSLLQQQAAAFQIPLRQLKLDDINPDKDLL